MIYKNIASLLPHLKGLNSLELQQLEATRQKKLLADPTSEFWNDWHAVLVWRTQKKLVRQAMGGWVTKKQTELFLEQHAGAS